MIQSFNQNNDKCKDEYLLDTSMIFHFLCWLTFYMFVCNNHRASSSRFWTFGLDFLSLNVWLDAVDDV